MPVTTRSGKKHKEYIKPPPRPRAKTTRPSSSAAAKRSTTAGAAKSEASPRGIAKVSMRKKAALAKRQARSMKRNEQNHQGQVTVVLSKLPWNDGSAYVAEDEESDPDGEAQAIEPGEVDALRIEHRHCGKKQVRKTRKLRDPNYWYESGDDEDDEMMDAVDEDELEHKPRPSAPKRSAKTKKSHDPTYLPTPDEEEDQDDMEIDRSTKATARRGRKRALSQIEGQDSCPRGRKRTRMNTPLRNGDEPATAQERPLPNDGSCPRDGQAASQELPATTQSALSNVSLSDTGRVPHDVRETTECQSAANLEEDSAEALQRDGKRLARKTARRWSEGVAPDGMLTLCALENTTLACHLLLTKLIKYDWRSPCFSKDDLISWIADGHQSNLKNHQDHAFRAGEAQRDHDGHIVAFSPMQSHDFQYLEELIEPYRPSWASDDPGTVVSLISHRIEELLNIPGVHEDTGHVREKFLWKSNEWIAAGDLVDLVNHMPRLVGDSRATTFFSPQAVIDTALRMVKFGELGYVSDQRTDSGRGWFSRTRRTVPGRLLWWDLQNLQREYRRLAFPLSSGASDDDLEDHEPPTWIALTGDGKTNSALQLMPHIALNRNLYTCIALRFGHLIHCLERQMAMRMSTSEHGMSLHRHEKIDAKSSYYTLLDSHFNRIARRMSKDIMSTRGGPGYTLSEREKTDACLRLALQRGELNDIWPLKVREMWSYAEASAAGAELMTIEKDRMLHLQVGQEPLRNEAILETLHTVNDDICSPLSDSSQRISSPLASGRLQIHEAVADILSCRESDGMLGGEDATLCDQLMDDQKMEWKTEKEDNSTASVEMKNAGGLPEGGWSEVFGNNVRVLRDHITASPSVSPATQPCPRMTEPSDSRNGSSQDINPLKRATEAWGLDKQEGYAPFRLQPAPKSTKRKAFLPMRLVDVFKRQKVTPLKSYDVRLEVIEDE